MPCLPGNIGSNMRALRTPDQKTYSNQHEAIHIQRSKRLFYSHRTTTALF